MSVVRKVVGAMLCTGLLLALVAFAETVSQEMPSASRGSDPAIISSTPTVYQSGNVVWGRVPY